MGGEVGQLAVVLSAVVVAVVGCSCHLGSHCRGQGAGRRVVVVVGLLMPSRCCGGSVSHFINEEKRP